MKRFSAVILLLFVFLAGCTTIPAVDSSVAIKGQVQIKVGDTTILTTNNTNIVWESLDVTIATVDQAGVVIGVKAGSTKIRASLVDNSEIFDEVHLEVREKEQYNPDCPECPEEVDCPDCPVFPNCPECPKIEPEKVQVKLGIDVIDKYLDIFAGKRVGLITNATGINSKYESTIDVLYEKVNLVALYAPEHGIRGNLQAGDKLGTYVDNKTGLTVYSLYGSTQRPTQAMLEGIDIMCIDLQDAGARFYTFIYTMAYAMQECAKYDIEFVVLDRPNPIGGAQFEGNILDMDYSSFIGLYPILQRHGLTIAELAMLFNKEFDINCTLHTVPMEGWDRRYYYDDTNLPWVIPSPNMPSVETAVVYPGTCIFEGTNLSEGRGTTIPFQVIGAPFIDADLWTNTLNALNLPGVTFRPAYFTPTFSKNSGAFCAGVQVHVTDRTTFAAVKTGWAMLDTIRDLYPQDFKVLSNGANRCMLDLNTGARYITLRTYNLEEQFGILSRDTAIFSITRSKYLLYPYLAD